MRVNERRRTACCCAETRFGIEVTGDLHCTYFYPFHLTLSVRSFIEITKLAFTVPGVKAFLSERLSQDPLEKFFECQRQRGGTSENPNVSEFCKNTQALRVINSVCGDVARGNCRGNN